MFNLVLGNILAVGSLEKHKQAELLSTTTEKWTAIEDYPYSGLNLNRTLISKLHRFYFPLKDFWIYAAATVHARGSYFIFGGWIDDYKTDVIAKFNPDIKQWSSVGQLNSARYSHGAIVIDDQFLVVGGNNQQKTERCYFVGDEINCISQEPTLVKYRHWPELIFVGNNYCV